MSGMLYQSSGIGSFSEGYETDYYKYVVSEDGYYSFTYDETEPGNNSAIISILDGNNNVKTTNSGSQDIITTETYLTAGSYYVSVYNSSSNSVIPAYTVSASISTVQITLIWD